MVTLVLQCPRWIDKDFTPFDPITLTEQTKKIVSKNSSRKYTHFYCTGVYRGISTGYTVGCNLRCIFCWVELSREFPEQMGEFYTPEEVVKNLILNAQKSGYLKLRISGGEPTLIQEHLLRVLDEIDKTKYMFILETNGILFGYDKEYALQIAKYRNVYVRISIKAGTEEAFQKKTGALGKFFIYPYLAVSNLLSAGVKFHVAAMTDPRLMSPDEKNNMLEILKTTGYNSYIEEEICDPYDTTLFRLKKSGMQIFL